MKIHGINRSVTPPDDRSDKSKPTAETRITNGDKIELSMQQDKSSNYPNDIPGENSGQSEMQRINWVRARAANGFYDKQGPTDKTVDLLIKNHKLADLMDRNQLKKNNGSGGDLIAASVKKSDKIAEIKQRIDDGYYDDPVHLAELAEIIIKEFKIE